MKRLVVGVLSLGLAVVLTGCPALDHQTFEALDESWQLLEPYTVAGINADSSLTAESRDLRLRLVEKFSRLLQVGLDDVP